MIMAEIWKNVKTPIGQLLISLLLLVIQTAQALDNGLALTPPMGWISWVRFTCEIDCKLYPDSCINSKLYETQANLLVEYGLDKLGYKYVNIDDCWSELKRDSQTNELVANATRFPEGIKGLAKKIHAKGLKLGIYGDCGTLTCANYPGQLISDDDLDENYFDLDAATFASWDVDSFKFDGCTIDPDRAETICPRMAGALKAQGRPVLLTCEWPFYQNRDSKELWTNWTLVAESCNLWRYYEDVEDSWDSVLAIIDYTVSIQDVIVQFHGPGAWFDPDQLVVGGFGLSLNQQRAQMAIWSLWSAPLFMSNDLRHTSRESRQLLGHKVLISIDQDKAGVFGYEVARSRIDPGNKQIMAFVKPMQPIDSLGCPSYAILYVNSNTLGTRRLVSFRLADLIAKALPAIEIFVHRIEGQMLSLGCIARFKDWPKQAANYELETFLDHSGLNPSNHGDQSNLTLWVNPSGASGVIIKNKQTKPLQTNKGL